MLPGHDESVQGPGLVLITTSPTEGEVFTVERYLARLYRMKRLVLTTARLIDEQLSRAGYKALMLTCTYREVEAWRAKHVSQLLDCIRAYLGRRGLKPIYVWVAELQKRGAMHYHIMMWLPKGWTLPKPDKRGWWPHGMTRIEFARKTAGYLAKYASKAQSKAEGDYPKGARISGNGGLDAMRRLVRRWWLAPGWVRELVPVISDVRRVVGGWLDVTSGELMKSPYYRCARTADWSVMMFCRRAST